MFIDVNNSQLDYTDFQNRFKDLMDKKGKRKSRIAAAYL